MKQFSIFPAISGIISNIVVTIMVIIGGLKEYCMKQFSIFSVSAGIIANIIVTTVVIIGGLYVGFTDSGSFLSLAMAAIISMFIGSLFKKRFTGSEFNMTQVIGSAGGILYAPSTLTAAIVSPGADGKFFMIIAIGFISSIIGMLTATKFTNSFKIENVNHFTEPKAIGITAKNMANEISYKSPLIWLGLILASIAMLTIFHYAGNLYSGGNEYVILALSTLVLFAGNYSVFISSGIIFPWKLVLMIIVGAVVSIPFMEYFIPLFLNYKISPFIPIVLLFIPSGIVQLFEIIKLKLESQNTEDIKQEKHLTIFGFIIGFVILSFFIDWKLAIIAQFLAIIVGWLSAFIIAKTNNNVLNILTRTFMYFIVILGGVFTGSAFAGSQFEILLMSVYISGFSYAFCDFTEDYVTSRPFETKISALIAGKTIGIILATIISAVIIYHLLPSIKTGLIDGSMPAPGPKSFLALSTIKDFPVYETILIIVLGLIWEIISKFVKNIPSTAHIALGAMLMGLTGYLYWNLVIMLIAGALVWRYRKNKNINEANYQYPIALAVGVLLFKTIYSLFL